MHSRSLLAKAVATAGLLLLLSAAQAQPTSEPRSRDPLDAKAKVPPATYRSALAGYRSGAEATPVPWRQANDTVARIGGWRAYAREATAPEVPASAPMRSAPEPAAARPQGPGHHGKH